MNMAHPMIHWGLPINLEKVSTGLHLNILKLEHVKTLMVIIDHVQVPQMKLSLLYI